MKDALLAALGSDPTGPAVDVLVTAGADLVTSDRAYDVFRRALPAMRGGTARLLPPSHWIDDPTAWSAPALTAFVQSVRATTTLTPVHDVSVVLVSIDPVAVGSDAGSMVLPPAKTLHLQIVVADVGNEAEKRVPVLATLTSSTGAAETVHDMVDLAPGQRTTVLLGGLRTVPDDRSTLTVSIGPVPGETATPDNNKVILLVVKPG